MAAAAPSTPPSAPTGVAASAADSAADLAWTAPAQGAPLDSYLIQAYDGATGYAGYEFACGTCTTFHYAGLSATHVYAFALYPHNALGYGPAGASGLVAPTSALCGMTPMCVAVDGASPTGPAVRRAQGFNSGIEQYTSSSLVQALAPSQWRSSADQPVFGTVRSMTPSVTTVLSDLWHNDTFNTARGSASSPWADWAGYAAWVQATVTRRDAAGERPDYWDIQNEADIYDFDPANPGNTALYLQQFKVAYDAIKAADPTAKVQGPSMSQFVVDPDPSQPRSVSLRAFLDFVDQQGIHLDALTWHDNGGSVFGVENAPNALFRHAEIVRTLLASHPSLGAVKVFANEYANEAAHLVPGWTAGWIANIEAADVDQANRTCWAVFDQGPVHLECQNGELDGLLRADGSTQAIYWVHRAYAAMTGTRLASTSTEPLLSVFGTQPATGRAQVMIGRHASCTPEVNAYCRQPTAPSAPPAPVTVMVRLPGTTGTVPYTLTRIPDQSGAVSQPQPLLSGVALVQGGVAAIVVPAVADGEAYTVTVG